MLTMKVITHSGSFHADDVFAIATLELFFDEPLDVVRTRDDAVIATGDVVVDVGAVYDHSLRRYDHHQNGAPVRENGIPYAAFGLVWRHYGESVAGSTEVAAAIEKKLVQPIDAGDNGVSLYELNDLGVAPFELFHLVSLFAPEWGSDADKDSAFLKAVAWARMVIERLIVKETANHTCDQLIKEVYEAASDKRLLEFELPVPATALVAYPDVMAVLCPDDLQTNRNWTVTAVRKSTDTFASRVLFPESWAGLRDGALQDASGLADAVFCHKARFFFVAGSREGARKAAEYLQ